MSQVEPDSLGQRLSRWLAIQVLASFALVSVVVYLAITNHLATRESNGLLEKQEIIEHMMDESRLDKEPAELWHMLDDFLSGHKELQVVVSDQNGSVVYEGADTFSGDHRTRSVIFKVPAFGGGNQPATVVLSINRHADEELLR